MAKPLPRGADRDGRPAPGKRRVNHPPGKVVAHDPAATGGGTTPPQPQASGGSRPARVANATAEAKCPPTRPVPTTLSPDEIIRHAQAYCTRLATKLSRMRQAKRISLRAAQKAGIVSRQSLRNLEKQKHNSSIYVAVVFCLCIGERPETVFGEDPADPGEGW